jgi:hypothetical protein
MLRALRLSESEFGARGCAATLPAKQVKTNANEERRQLCTMNSHCMTVLHLI